MTLDDLIQSLTPEMYQNLRTGHNRALSSIVA